MIVHLSTAPTSCSAISTGSADEAARPAVRRRRRRARHGRRRCSKKGRRTSASPPITSSSRSATTSGPATRPARASIRRCGRSSIRSKRRSWRWASSTWPMVELEADDALASAAHLAAADPRVEKVCIWTPDKDLAQCVVGDRVVQVDRRSGEIRNAAARAGEVRRRPGVHPRLPRARRRRGGRLSRHRRASARRPPHASSVSTATSSSSPRAFSARTASARCSSRRSRRCAPTRRCLTTSTSCAGRARRQAFPAVAEKIGNPRLAETSERYFRRLIIVPHEC